MKRRTILMIISSLLTLVLILLIILQPTINKKLNQSPITNYNTLESCNTLTYNGEGKINLVFFSDKQTAESYSSFLLNVPPFNNNKDSFNIYYIPDYKPECEIYKDTALLCYSRDLIQKASSCPNDYIIAFEDQPTSIRSSAYINVMSINKKHPKSVLVHEFGHAFANLAEEYVPGNIPSGSQNCQSTCDNFNGNSCFQGCSKSNYYRSIDSGIMRTLSSLEYGSFNDEIIQNQITKKDKSITGNLIQNYFTCASQAYYLIELEKKESLELKSKSVEFGCLTSYTSSGSYNLTVQLQDSTSTLGTINPEIIFTDSQEDSEQTISGESYISDKPFYIKVPISQNIKKLTISSPNSSIEVNLNDLGARPCKI